MKQGILNILARVATCSLFFLSLHSPLFAHESGEHVSSTPGIPVSPSTIPKISDKELAHLAVSGKAQEAPKPFDPELEAYKQQLSQGKIPLLKRPFLLEQQDLTQPFFGYAPAAPSQYTNFSGISYTAWYPPDPTAAVGPNHIIVMVNGSWAIYDKTGSKLYQTTLASWWANVSPLGSVFDPKVIYDQYAGRWILLAVAHDAATGISSYLISASATSDPTGSWWSWKLDATLNGSTPTSYWADYPQLGFDDMGAVYITSNQFNAANTFIYSKVRVLQKSQLYTGASASWNDFWNLLNGDGTAAFTLQPVHSFSNPNGEYLVNTVSRLSGNAITLWKITNPTTTPALNRVAAISVGSYSAPPSAQQLGGGTPIDTGDSRLLNAVYRSGRVCTAFSETYNWGSGNVSAIRHVVIDTGGSTVAIDSRYGADGYYYFYPAIYPDASNNLVMVFNRSSATEYAGIRYTGRLTTDSVMQTSAPLKTGEGNYVLLDSNGRNRWGDYNGIGLDPIDGNKVWIFSEYATNVNTWATWIGAVQFYTLAVSLGASPQNGAAPLNTNLTANVSGTAIGTINYTFWWNCSDPGTSVGVVMAICGSIPAPAAGTCSSNTNGIKCDGVTDNPKIVSNTYLSAGTYTAKVIAERGSASPAESRFNLVVNAPAISVGVATSPTGRQITVDGSNYTAPQSFNWTQGSNHTISVPSPQSGGAGTQYVFSSWSDGGVQTHTIATPASATTYTASFTTRYLLTTTVNPPGSGTVTLGGFYDAGSMPSLNATPNSDNVFASWSGNCSGTNNPTTVNMIAPKTCTANFSLKPVRIAGTPPIYYTSIPVAYAAAVNNNVIQVQAITYGGPITFNRTDIPGLSLTLKGGYNAAYSDNTGMTIVGGPVTIESGTITLDNVLIQ